MSQSPTFKDDWFTKNIPTFRDNLSHLRGKPCKILEIGSNEGRATTWLLQNIATHESSSLVCIDPSPPENFTTNIKLAGGESKVGFVEKFSYEALPALPPDEFDFIYIDGSHTTINVLEDAVLSFRLCKVGGIIAFDDYKWSDPSSLLFSEGVPMPAIDAFLSIYKNKIEVLRKRYQVWVRKVADVV